MQNLLKSWRGLPIVIFVLAVSFFVLGNVAPAKATTAETCTWTASSTAIMSDNTNWDAGGGVSCIEIDASDALVFDGTVTTTNAVWDVGLTEVASVTVNGTYSGTITVGAADATSTGNFVVNGGTITHSGVGTLRVGGSLTVATGAVYSGTNGKVLLYGESTLGGAGSATFYNLELTATSTLAGNVTISNVLTTRANFYPLTYTLTLSGGGTPWLTFGGMVSSSLSTVVFTGSGTVTLPQLGSYYNLTLNNAVGVFVFSGMLPSISNNFTITAGTASSSVDSQFMVGMGGPGGGSAGHLINNGTFTQTVGSISMQGDGSTISGTGVYNFNSLFVATTTLSSNITVNGVLTVNSGGTFDAGGSRITLTSSSVPFVVSGVFSPSTSTIIYSGSSATTIASASYYDLVVSTTASLGGSVTTTNDLTINTGGSLITDGNNVVADGDIIVNGTLNNNTGTITMNGTHNLGGGGTITGINSLILNGVTTLMNSVSISNTISGAGTLNCGANSITLALVGANPFAAFSGVFNAGTGTTTYSGNGAVVGGLTYYDLQILNNATLAGNVTTTNDFTIYNSSPTVVDFGGYSANVAGHMINYGVITASAGSTLTMTGTDKILGGTGTAALYNLIIDNNITLNGNVTTTHVLTINEGDSLTVNTNERLIFTGEGAPFVINGTFVPNQSTIVYAGTGVVTMASGTFYDVILNTTSTLGGNTTVSHVLTQNANFDAATYTLELSGSGTPWSMSSGMFTASTSTLKFLGSGTVNLPSLASIYNLTLDNAAGTFVPYSNFGIINNDFNILAGSVTLPGNQLQVSGNLVNNGTLIQNSESIRMTGSAIGAKTFGGTGTTTINQLIIDHDTNLVGNVSASSTVTVNTGKILDAVTSTLTLSGSGTPLLVIGTFTASTSTVVYSGLSATNLASTTYYNLTVDTVGALVGDVTTTYNLLVNSGYSLDASGYNLVVGNNLTISIGSVSQTSGNLTVSGALLVTGSGTFDKTGGNLVVEEALGETSNGTINQTGGTATIGSPGHSAYIGGPEGTTNLTNVTVTGGNPYNLDGNVTVTGTLTIDTGTTLTGSNNTLTLTGAGTPFVINGTFTAQTSNVVYSNVGSQAIATGAYYNLTVSSTATLAGNVTTTNNLTVNSGKSLTQSSGTVVMSGVGNLGGSSGNTTLYDLQVSGTTTLVGVVTTTRDVTVDSGKVLALSTKNLNVGRHLSNAGTVTQTSGTVTMSGTGNLGGTGSTQVAALTTAGTVTLAGDVTASSTVTISGTLDGATKTLTLTGTGTPLVISGTFTPSTSTVVFSGTSANIPAATYYNLTANGTDTLIGNVTSTNLLTINTSKSLDAATYNIVLSGSGTPLVKTGTFTASTSTVYYTSTGTVTTTGATYYALTLGTGTYTFDASATTTNSFVNGGAVTIPLGMILYAPGTFDNNGTTTESGIIKHPMTYSKLSDVSGTEVSSYSAGSATVYVAVQDDDGNLHKNSVDTISVGAGSAIAASGYSDSESIASVTLTETGADTGIFVGTAYPFQVVASKTNNNGKFDVSGNGTLTLAFVDDKDTSDTGSDTASFTASTYTASASSGGSAAPASTLPTVGANPVSISGSVVSGNIVTLNFSATNAALVAISEDPNFTGVSWQTYSSSKSYTLSSGSGAKKIYVKFRSADGGTTDVYTLNTILSGVGSVVTTPATTVVALTAELGVVINPGSTVAITKLPAASMQPGVALKYNYQYKNKSAKSLSVKIVRQMIDTKGKVVKTTTAYQTIKAGATFKGAVSETISKTTKPGNYTVKVKMYNSKTNKLVDENSFKVEVEKLKNKYFALLGEASPVDSSLLFDSSSLAKIKSNVVLPANFSVKYSYTNNTEKKQTVRMVRQLINAAGKVVDTKTGKWTMVPGEKDSSAFTQPVASNLAVGDYTIRIQALDYTTKAVLAENNLGFRVELK